MASSASTFAGPLTIGDPGPIRALRAALVAAGFTSAHIAAALGGTGQMLVRSSDGPVLRRRLDGRGALGTICALFILDLPVPEAEVVAALAPLTIAELTRLGLVESDGNAVRTRVRIVPHDDVLIVSDRSGTGEDHPVDHVAGLHNPSVTLANLTVRAPVARALDLGTGNGIQAILAAREADAVVATDINERALNFAAFNAVLNGVENIEWRRGSFFEPLAGEQFDLIVSNPPFVISPETAYVFRDSGLGGDTVSRELVRAAPDALAEGGYASLLLSWIHGSGEEWSARLREWLDGSGCDALLLHYGTQDPLTHASNWTRDRYSADPAGFDEALERWLGYLAQHEIEGIAYGAIVLRRRDGGPNWILEHEVAPTGLRPAGAHIRRMFDAQDYLNGLPSDDDLLMDRFALTEHAEVEQRAALREGRWVAESVELRLDEGLGFAAGIDPPTAAFLAALDGKRTLAEVTAGLAAPKQQDPAAVAKGSLPVIRGLLTLGYVERVGD